MAHFISFLIIALVVFSFLQKGRARQVAAILFSCMGFAFHWYSLPASVDGFHYYAGAALWSLLFIILMLGLKPLPKLGLRLAILCGASILMNIFWYFWPWYLPQIMYDLFYVAFYGIALFLITRKPGLEESIDDRPVSLGVFSLRINFGSSRRSVD